MSIDWSSLEASLVQQVPAVLAVLESSGKLVVAKLSVISLAAAQSASELLQSIKDASQLVVTGRVSAEDAKAATASYWEAFRLIGLTLKEASQIAVFNEAKEVVGKIESIGLTLLGGLGSTILKGII